MGKPTANMFISPAQVEATAEYTPDKAFKWPSMQTASQNSLSLTSSVPPSGCTGYQLISALPSDAGLSVCLQQSKLDRQEYENQEQ